MRPRIPLALLASAAASLLLPPPVAAAAQTHTIIIDKMKFLSVPAQVRRGDVILWVNRDLFQHTATAKNGLFDVDLPPGAEAQTVMRTPGVVSFACRYHPGMHGSLRVAQR